MPSLRRARRRARGRFELGVSPPRRERRWPRPPWKRIAFSLLALAMLGSVSYGVAWAVLGDALRVRDVTIVGVQVADPFAVAAAADVTGESLLTLDTAAVAERVAALPVVREARVQRDWPRGVIIDITEHQGWGYWQVGDVRRVIDADGQLVASARPPEAGAPTIVEVGRALADGAEMTPDRDSVRLVARLLGDGTFDLLRVRPAGFVFHRDRGLTVLIDDGPDAVLGDSHSYEFKVATWGALLDGIEQQALEGVREIDLRFGRRVVMR